MNILIIDNGTSYLPQLKNLLRNHDITVEKYFELKDVSFERFDIVVLSGGHSIPLLGNESRFEKEIDFVRNADRPIFGICFGFEIIAHVYGASLELMDKKEKGIMKINIIPDDIFLNIFEFEVFESHRWVIREIPDNLVALASSKDGIEMVRHKDKPVYATQFHPEMFLETTCGDEVFNNFLKKYESKEK